MENNYYEKYINFLKKYNLYNEEIIKYIRRNSTPIDYLEEELRCLIGCYYTYDKNKRLKKINITVPYFKSEITTLINIHEYIHVYIAYPYLYKKYKITKEEEMLALLYEQLYYLDNQTPYLKEAIDILNRQILTSEKTEYKIALQYKQELLNYYTNEKPTFKKLQRKAKKLSNRHISK